jgi:hypothetical protein
MTLEFSVQFFRKKTQISNFAKIRPVRAELFHADGRTDRNDETNGRFSQFGEGALKHVKFLRTAPHIEFLNDSYQRSRMLCAKAVGF